MKLKGIVEEDFLQYKKPCMFIITPYCDFKCDKEYCGNICQNGSLAKAKTLDIEDEYIVDKYLNNPITKSIVFGGLEPFDSPDELINLIIEFRKFTKDDIVIYTGFYKEEIQKWINILINYPNIIIKFGRFLPDQEKHFDETLGIYLASDNQYAVKIS